VLIESEHGDAVAWQLLSHRGDSEEAARRLAVMDRELGTLQEQRDWSVEEVDPDKQPGVGTVAVALVKPAVVGTVASVPVSRGPRSPRKALQPWEAVLDPFGSRESEEEETEDDEDEDEEQDEVSKEDAEVVAVNMVGGSGTVDESWRPGGGGWPRVGALPWSAPTMAQIDSSMCGTPRAPKALSRVPPCFMSRSPIIHAK
jgi:hypothetical protein